MCLNVFLSTSYFRMLVSISKLPAWISFPFAMASNVRSSLHKWCRLLSSASRSSSFNSLCLFLGFWAAVRGAYPGFILSTIPFLEPSLPPGELIVPVWAHLGEFSLEEITPPNYDFNWLCRSTLRLPVPPLPALLWSYTDTLFGSFPLFSPPSLLSPSSSPCRLPLSQIF